VVSAVSVDNNPECTEQKLKVNATMNRQKNPAQNQTLKMQGDDSQSNLKGLR
jgi:hypothetical protein